MTTKQTRFRRALMAGAAAATLALVAPATVHASDDGHGDDHGDDRGDGHVHTPQLSAPIAQGLAGPLQIAVGGDHTVYVAQDFASLLTRIGPHGTTDLASNPGGEIAGVDDRGGSIYYTTANADPTTEAVTASTLSVYRHGSTHQVADLFQFESNNNPDQHQSYGFESISADCAAQWPVEQMGPAQYTGIIDSHPYAVAAGKHSVYVADAAGNDILEVDRAGHPRVVALLPPQPLVITADAVAALKLPACVVGLTYDFEAVPTDVEIGSDGFLYVTTLPGGPEDPSLGARGSVYRIDPDTGQFEKIAQDLLGATNLALGRHGQIFVTELFANRVSRIVNGEPQKLLDLTSPASLEYAHGKLYVGYDVFANGTVATISFGHDGEDD
jgi:hypothetical protein